MKERKSVSISRLSGHESRRRKRVLILTELKGICLKIGRAQCSAEGRLASREVARLLDEMLAREARPRLRRRS